MAGEIDGLRELDRKLAELGRQTGVKVLQQACGAAMTPVVNAARQMAPKGSKAHRTYKGRLVAPGFLSRNIKKRTYKDKAGRWAGAFVGASREAFYGPMFQELGTKHHAAQPFLQPAFENNRATVENRLKAELRKRIDKVKRMR